MNFRPNGSITTDRMRDKIVTAVIWARLRKAPASLEDLQELFIFYSTPLLHRVAS